MEAEQPDPRQRGGEEQSLGEPGEAAVARTWWMDLRRCDRDHQPGEDQRSEDQGCGGHSSPARIPSEDASEHECADDEAEEHEHAGQVVHRAFCCVAGLAVGARGIGLEETRPDEPDTDDEQQRDAESLALPRDERSAQPAHHGERSGGGGEDAGLHEPSRLPVGVVGPEALDRVEVGLHGVHHREHRREGGDTGDADRAEHRRRVASGVGRVEAHHAVHIAPPACWREPWRLPVDGSGCTVASSPARGED